MHKCGFVPKRDHKSKGKGRNSKRAQNKYGFHSFRGTATSWLKNAGVSEAVAMDIIGHDSRAISQVYTRIDLKVKHAAVKKMARYVANSQAVK
jgi:integrase